MSLIVNSGGGASFDPIPAGVHLGVCIWLIDVGSSWSEMYQKWTRKILTTWELPEERITIKDQNGNEEDKPRVLSKSYTPSLNAKANLRADLVSWRGRDFRPEEEAAFDLHTIVGAACQLNVIHVTKNGKTYANIKAIIPAPKGSKPVPETPTIVYDIDTDGLAIPEGMPQWIHDKIVESPEYKKLSNPGMNSPENPEESWPVEDEVPADLDEIPFS